MVRFLGFLLALAVSPFAWGLSHAAFDVFRRIPASGGSVLAPGVVAMFLGIALQLLLWIFLPPPIRLYVLGHELTHAFWGKCFGARVSNLKVGLQGGSVTLTKSNVLITLAPYFFPFYTILIVLVALLVRMFVSPLPCPCVWLFAIGFTWCFHICFTLRSLAQRQPDIQECGNLFSYVFIWIFNVAGMAVWIVCTTEISWTTLWVRILARSGHAYAKVGSWFVWVYESLRTLPVLQG